MARPISRRRRLASLFTRIAPQFSTRALLAAALLGCIPPTWSADGDLESHGVILLYHHISDTTPPSTSTSPDDFAAQLDWLAANDYTILPASKLVAGIKAGAVPRRTVAITFDDAFANLLTHAAPLLEAHDMPYTLFVATEPIGRRGYLTWDDIRALIQRGAEIGNHTVSHSHLQRRLDGESELVWRERIVAEIQDAGTVIEAELGERPTLFAYPYGEYTPEVQAIVAELELIGFGQQSGAAGPDADLTLLPRFSLSGPYGKDFAAFKIKAATLPLPLTRASLNPVVAFDAENGPALQLRLRHGFDPARLTCFGPVGALRVTMAGRIATIAASNALPPGRSRYNCPAPAGDGRFYWYSQLWIKQAVAGVWARE